MYPKIRCDGYCTNFFMELNAIHNLCLTVRGAADPYCQSAGYIRLAASPLMIVIKRNKNHLQLCWNGSAPADAWMSG